MSIKTGLKVSNNAHIKFKHLFDKHGENLVFNDENIDNKLYSNIILQEFCKLNRGNTSIMLRLFSNFKDNLIAKTKTTYDFKYTLDNVFLLQRKADKTFKHQFYINKNLILDTFSKLNDKNYFFSTLNLFTNIGVIEHTILDPALFSVFNSFDYDQIFEDSLENKRNNLNNLLNDFACKRNI